MNGKVKSSDRALDILEAFSEPDAFYKNSYALSKIFM